MSAAMIKSRLLQVQADGDAIRTDDVSRLEGSIDELCKLKPNELADRLLEWEPAAPDALNLLLRAAARSDRSALHFARALVQLLTTWKDGLGPWLGVDEVLLRAFPQLGSPERDWVAERAAIREKYELVPGKDFVPMGDPREEDQWPANQPLPPLDSTRGVQARLLRAGYNCGPITGEWNEATRRALVRYQVEKAIRPSGELDEPTRIRLADEE
jgi:hypothetical protein